MHIPANIQLILYASHMLSQQIVILHSNSSLSRQYSSFQIRQILSRKNNVLWNPTHFLHFHQTCMQCKLNQTLIQYSRMKKYAAKLTCPIVYKWTKQTRFPGEGTHANIIAKKWKFDVWIHFIYMLKKTSWGKMIFFCYSRNYLIGIDALF